MVLCAWAFLVSGTECCLDVRGFLFSVVLYFHKTWRNSTSGGDGGILAHLSSMVEMNFSVVGGE